MILQILNVQKMKWKSYNETKNRMKSKTLVQDQLLSTLSIFAWKLDLRRRKNH